MTPFSGLKIRTEAAETEVLLGATAAEAEAALRSVATDVDAGHQMLFAFENSVQVSLDDGAVAALEVALRHGPTSVHIGDVDLVSSPAADVLPVFTRLNDGEILSEGALDPIFMNLGVAVWRRFSEDDVALERAERLPSAEEDYGSLEAFEQAFDDEYEQARWLESALICTREYLEAYRQFE